jgi:hypothetical protein
MFSKYRPSGKGQTTKYCPQGQFPHLSIFNYPFPPFCGGDGGIKKNVLPFLAFSKTESIIPALPDGMPFFVLKGGQSAGQHDTNMPEQCCSGDNFRVRQQFKNRLWTDWLNFTFQTVQAE